MVLDAVVCAHWLLRDRLGETDGAEGGKPNGEVLQPPAGSSGTQGCKWAQAQKGHPAVT
jgi:hypothetical protein